MNTVKELREALAEEVRRLQPPPGLESRVLRQALHSITADSTRGGSRRDAIRPWQSRRRGPLPAGVRALRAVAAVLLILVIVVGIFLGGRVLRDWGTVPAHPSTHAVARSLSGMVSPAVGWQIDSGNVQRTTDGGAHWTYVEPATGVPPFGDSGYFLDATHAWVTETIGNGRINLHTYRTADGGKTWDKGTDIAAVGEGGLNPGLYFLDPTHGWMLLNIVTIGVPASETPHPDMVEDALYGTSDGGLHWTPLASNLHTQGSGCDWKGAAFASVSDGWLTVTCGSPNTSDSLLVTHDGGRTWSPQELPLITAGLTCPCSADPITVFDREHAAIVVRGSGIPSAEQRVFMTADGGNSWTAPSLPGAEQFIVDFIDPRHGWTVAGPSGFFERDSSGRFPILPGVNVPLYRTDNGGLTWVPVRTNLPFSDANGRLSDLYFVDLQHGFASTSQFLRTEDGGLHWAVVVQTQHP